jgi:hypothetical protein
LKAYKPNGRNKRAMSGQERRILVTNLDPIRILSLRSANEFEEIVEDWQRALKQRYSTIRVERVGGPGDMGRDIICTEANGDSVIYQCKHYGRELNKQDVLKEIGKCCFYCSNGFYPLPRKYYFVSPLGLNGTTRDLVNNPEELRKELLSKWSSYCETKISSERIPLEARLRGFITELEFRIFSYIVPKDFIEEIGRTPYYLKWFGEFIKPRSLIDSAPQEISEKEANYIRKLLEAYSEYLRENVEEAERLRQIKPELWENLQRQRNCFYSAEYLAAYSRDNCDPESRWFERLQEEFYYGIVDEIRKDAADGFERLQKVLDRAEVIQPYAGNPLNKELGLKDRWGICHQLANEREEIKWKT